MKGNRNYLNTLELMLVEAYENFCGGSVEEDCGSFTIDGDFTCSYADLMNVILSDLNNHIIEHFKLTYETQTKPNDTTIKEPLSIDDIGIEYHNANIYAFKDFGSLRYEVGSLEPKTLDFYHISGEIAELVESKSREDMNILEYELYKVLYKAMTEEKERLLPHCDKPFTACFNTGGYVFCTIYQMSGENSDLYYALDNDSDNYMFLYSHSGDLADGFNDEFAFYHRIKEIDITSAEATKEEIDIFYAMKAEEAKTLKAFK